MPKRTAEEKIERYQRKIQKLSENKQKRRRVHVIYSDSSDEDEGARFEKTTISADVHNGETDAPVAPPPEAPADPVSPAEPAAVVNDVLPTALEQEGLVPVMQEPSLEKPADGETPGEELDPVLLQALGESIDDTPEFGAKIHESLAKLWPPILKKGITKENKDKVLKEYLVPDNCQLLQAPKLNAEISAAVPEMVRNRDKTLTTNQQQLGYGITAINRALDLLLKRDDKKQAIQHLSNSCRILADPHSTLTLNRIKLITPSLDKNFLHVIQDAARDDTLFGNKLSDKIKAAKAIERQGHQIKKVTNPKASSSTHQTNVRTSNSGNWPAPPRYQSNRGGRGGWKKSAPTTNRRPYTNPTQQATKSPAANKPRTPTTQ